jgi:hypothetical protein
MKKNLLVCCGLILLSVAAVAQEFSATLLNSTLQQDTAKKSVKMRQAYAWGKDSIILSYHSPAVRGRTIWGGVVPFDEVWVSGAHMATSIEFPFAVTLQGKKVGKGKYALFTIPRKEGNWILILNKNWEQHLADEYDSKEDVIRLEISPQQLPKKVERLQWLVQTTDKNNAFAWLIWENKAVVFSLQR